MIRPSFASASLLFLFLSLTLSERIPTEAEKRQASRQKHLAPIIATSSPQDGVLRRYASPEDCYRDPPRTQWQSSASFATDICHNLNPHLTQGLSISTPAICSNGTRAAFVSFRYSSCRESNLGPAGRLSVSDAEVGMCIDARQLWSFAFVCEGLPESVDGGWLGPGGVLVLIVGLILLALGLGTALMFCGISVVFVGGFGLLTWGFWTLGKLILVKFQRKGVIRLLTSGRLRLGRVRVLWS